jgi:hypothetical protein
MAIVLTEEARRRLEDIRALLRRAVRTLVDLTEAGHSELGQALQQSLRWTLLQPLQLHIAVLDQLLSHGTLSASQPADTAQEPGSSAATADEAANTGPAQPEQDTGAPGTAPGAEDSTPP